MQRAELIAFLRHHKLAVEATIGAGGGPRAAVVGIAVSDELEIIFDTVQTARKHRSLRADPRIALVIARADERTAQIEWVAAFPAGAELDRVRECYFAAYPDGRDRLRWPGITHVRVRPTWVRYSDFTKDPPEILELPVG